MAATNSNTIPFWTDALSDWDVDSYDQPPDAWSVVAMGPNLQQLPGILEDGNPHWKKPPHRIIDKGRKPGVDGQTPKLLGFGCAEFDLKMIIHERTQLSGLQSILPQIWFGKSSPVTITPNSPGSSIAPGNGIPGAQYTVGLDLTQSTPGGGSAPKGARDRPILIYHPELSLAGITQVLLESWTPPVRWQGKNDIKFYTLHCIEFRDGKAIQSTTPTQPAPPVNGKTLPKGNPNTPPSANDAGPRMVGTGS